MVTVVRNLMTVLVLVGTAIDVTPPECSNGAANQHRKCRCCQGANASCSMSNCCCKTPMSQDRSNAPLQRRSQDDRQLSPSTTATLATVACDSATSGHGLFELSLSGTALSVPTLQAQHVRIQA